MPLPKAPSQARNDSRTPCCRTDPSRRRHIPEERRTADAAGRFPAAPALIAAAGAGPASADKSNGKLHALAQPAAAPQRKARLQAVPTRRRMFVLDTNVLMHDPTSLFRFEEHDLFLPMMTLEELDGHKKGMSEVARNARQASRSLDALVASCRRRSRRGSNSTPWATRTGDRPPVPADPGHRCRLPASLPDGKADNHILSVVRALKQLHPDRDVVLVSKDINMRVKARALDLRCRGLLQRQGARGHRHPLHRRLCAGRQLLGQARQGHGVLATIGRHLLSHHRAGSGRTAGQPVRLSRGGHAVLRPGARNPRQDRGAARAARLPARQEQRFGA
jgi:hypothetical protein